MTHQSDADTIEAGIERERASLASTLDTLQDRISVEHLAQEALGMVRTNAAIYTRSIDNAVRSNPLALALTGVGIAWLIFGNRKSSDSSDSRASPRLDHDDPTRREFPDDLSPPRDMGADDGWSHAIDTMRDKASAKIAAIEEDARSRASNLRAGISHGFAEARDFAAERSAVLADFARDMKKGFRHGLDDLSETAQERVAAIRERAYAARIRGERTIRRGTREAGRLIEDHPLVAGAVALALGAALAAALPHTRKEDRAFGDESDRLAKEANRLLRQERDRVARVAAGVADELKAGSKSALDSVADQVAKTAKAVKERAEEEAHAGSAPVKPVTTAGASNKESGGGGRSS